MDDKVTVSTYEFFQMFPDQEAARRYLEGQLWPNGPVCPECGSGDNITARKSGYYRCNPCRLDFTIRTGTIFERSHVPLHKWLYAMYLLLTARKGISSLQLSKELSITQKTTWFMLHRLREACADDSIQLAGIVEIDETFVGGKETNKHKSKKLNAGRGFVGKTVVLGMRERGGKTRAMVISGTSTGVIQSEVVANVAEGATICTDEHSAYNGMEQFTHLSVNHSANEFVKGMAHTNGMESVWAVFKRGLYGVYHHVAMKHVGRYTNEFSFRLTDGNVKRPTMDRLGSMVAGTAGRRLTYRRLTQ